MKELKSLEVDTLIDPDPFSIILSILGALGSVASIVSLGKQHYEKQHQLKLSKEIRSQLLDIIGSMDASISVIEAQFERIILTIQMAKGGWSSDMGSMVLPEDYEKAPSKLGGISLYLPERMLKDLKRTHLKILSESKNLVDKTYRIITVAERYDLALSHDTHLMLEKFQDELNKVFSESSQFKKSTIKCRDAILVGREAIKMLKEDIKGD